MGINLLLHDDIQAWFNHFSAFSGVRIALFDPDGRELRSGEARREQCTYCSFLRERLGQEPVCRALDRRQFARARRSGRLVSYRCHGGLNEAILPVHDEGVLTGFVMIGQFRTCDMEPAAMRHRCATRRVEAA